VPCYRWRVRREDGVVRLRSEHARERFGRRAPAERRGAGQQFVEDDAKGPDVCLAARRVASRLFGAHIRGTPHDDAGLGANPRHRGGAVGGSRKGFRQPEVQHLDRAIRAHLDVGRFQIAMDDPLFVRRFHGLRDLPGDGKCFSGGDRTPRDAVRERRPVDQLHHQRDRGSRSFQAVDRRDVRMIERGEDLGLTLKPSQSLRVYSNRRR
jgi:hypothetical protein